jgi:hypothetical protein
MLEGLLESLLLNRLKLGEYIEDLDKSKFHTSLFSGTIQLNDLILKEKKINQLPAVLNSAFQIQYGYIKHFYVYIPWTAIASQSIQITVDGLYCMISDKSLNPEQQNNHSNEIELDIAAQSHMQQLELGERIRQSNKEAEPKEAGSEASFFISLLNKCIANIQVTIKNIHFRYESATNESGVTKFAFGITAAELAAFTVDSQGNKSFVDNKSKANVSLPDTIQKQLNIDSLSIYLNPNTKSWRSMQTSALKHSFQASIAKLSADSNESFLVKNETRSRSHKFYYLLEPLNANCGLTINNSRDLSQPKYSLVSKFSSLNFHLNSEQYKQAVHNLNNISKNKINKQITFTNAIKKCNYLKPINKPFHLVDGENNSLSNCGQWWRYSIQCVLLLTRIGLQRRQADAYKRGIIDSDSERKSGHLNILEQSKLYRQYVPLYKRRQGVSWLTPLDEDDYEVINKIELAIDIDTILHWRDVGDAELLAEAEQKSRLDQLKQAKAAQKSYVGAMFSYLTGSSSAASDSEAKSEAIGLNIEQRLELLEAIGYKEEKKPLGLTPLAIAANYIETKVSLEISEATVTLTTLTEATSSANEGELIPSGLTLGRIAEISLLYEAAPIRLDGFNPFKSTLTIQSIQLKDITQSNKYNTMLNSLNDSSTPFLRLKYINKPFQSPLDWILNMDLAQLQVLYNPEWCCRVVSFAVIPSLLNESQSLFSVAAEISHSMQAEFIRTITNMAEFGLSINSKGFKLILPTQWQTKVEEKSNLPSNEPFGNVLLFEVNHLCLFSNQDKQDNASSAKSSDIIQYDSYTMRLSDIKLLEYSSLVQVENSSPNDASTILEPLDVELSAKVCRSANVPEEDENSPVKYVMECRANLLALHAFPSAISSSLDLFQTSFKAFQPIIQSFTQNNAAELMEQKETSIRTSLVVTNRAKRRRLLLGLVVESLQLHIGTLSNQMNQPLLLATAESLAASCQITRVEYLVSCSVQSFAVNNISSLSHSVIKKFIYSIAHEQSNNSQILAIKYRYLPSANTAVNEREAVIRSTLQISVGSAIAVYDPDYLLLLYKELQSLLLLNAIIKIASTAQNTLTQAITNATNTSDIIAAFIPQPPNTNDLALKSSLKHAIVKLLMELSIEDIAIYIAQPQEERFLVAAAAQRIKLFLQVISKKDSQVYDNPILSKTTRTTQDQAGYILCEASIFSLSAVDLLHSAKFGDSLPQLHSNRIPPVFRCGALDDNQLNNPSLTVQFNAYTPQQLSYYGLDSATSVQINNVQAVAINSTVLRIIDFINSGLMAMLLSNTKAYLAAATRIQPEKYSSLTQIIIDNPIVLIPLFPSTAQFPFDWFHTAKYFQADLGQISIKFNSNVVEARKDLSPSYPLQAAYLIQQNVFAIKIAAMHLNCSLDNQYNHHVIDDINMQLLLQNDIYIAAKATQAAEYELVVHSKASIPLPNWLIRAVVSDINIALSAAHHLLAMQIFQQTMLTLEQRQLHLANIHRSSSTAKAECFEEQLYTFQTQFTLERIRLQLLLPFAAPSIRPVLDSSTGINPWCWCNFNLAHFAMNLNIDADQSLQFELWLRSLSAEDNQAGTARAILHSFINSGEPSPDEQVDELCIKFAKMAKKQLVTLNNVSHNIMPISGSIELSNPCIVVIPDFVYRLIDFISVTNPQEHGLPFIQSKSQLIPSVQEKQMPTTYAVDLNLKVSNGRVVLVPDSNPQSNALVATYSFAVKLTNEFGVYTDIHKATRLENSESKKSLDDFFSMSDEQKLTLHASSKASNAAAALSSHRFYCNQTIELGMTNLEVFVCVADKPLLTNIAHRLLAPCHYTATLGVNFLLKSDDLEAHKFGIASNLVEEGTCRALIRADPLICQLSYPDIELLYNILMFAKVKPELPAHSDSPLYNSSSAQFDSKEIAEFNLALSAAPDESLYLAKPHPISNLTNLFDYDGNTASRNDDQVDSDLLNELQSGGALYLWYVENLIYTDISVVSISATVIKDYNGTSSVPLLHIYFYETQAVWSRPYADSNSQALLETTMQVSFYDAALVQWQVIADFCQYRISMETQLISNIIKVAEASSSQQTGGLAESNSTLQLRNLSISFKMDCLIGQEIHISDKLLGSLFNTIRLWSHQYQSRNPATSITDLLSPNGSKSVVIRQQIFSPFLLRNWSGSNICCWTVLQDETTESNINYSFVNNQQEEPLQLTAGANATVADQLVTGSPISLCVQFGNAVVEKKCSAGDRHTPSDFLPLYNIPISKAETRAYKINLVKSKTASPYDLSLRPPTLLVKVSLNNGSKVITLSSNCSIINHTQLTMQVRLLSTLHPEIAANSSQPQLADNTLTELDLGCVEPNATLSFPIDSPKFVWAAVQIRPADFGLAWSTHATLRAKLYQSLQQQLIFCAAEASTTKGNAAENENLPTAAFVCHMVASSVSHSAEPTATSKQQQSQAAQATAVEELTLEIHSPLMIRNLLAGPLNYQIRHSEVKFICEGIVPSGGLVSLHETDLRLNPQVRFQLHNCAWTDWQHILPQQKTSEHNYAAELAFFNKSDDCQLLTYLSSRLSEVSLARILTLYCPFYLTDLTGNTLQYMMTEEVYENQRKLGWNWQKPYLPTDRTQYSTKEGQTQNMSNHLASTAWVWVDNWKLDSRYSTDAEGWRYAVDFPSDYHDTQHMPIDCVRRRKWIRNRALKPFDVAPKNTDDAKDISLESILSSSRMFAPSLHQRNEFFIQIGFNDTAASQLINFASVKRDGVISLLSKASKGNKKVLYDIACNIDQGAELFKPIKFITFHPRYIIHNNLNQAIFIKQFQAEEVLAIPSDSIFPFFGRELFQYSKFNPLIFQAAFQHCNFSQPFIIKQSEPFNIKFYLSEEKKKAATDLSNVIPFIIRVRCEQLRAVMHIYFHQESFTDCLYRIENRTNERIMFQQLKPNCAKSNPQFALPGYLQPHTATAYAWDWIITDTISNSNEEKGEEQSNLLPVDKQLAVRILPCAYTVEKGCLLKFDHIGSSAVVKFYDDMQRNPSLKFKLTVRLEDECKVLQIIQINEAEEVRLLKRLETDSNIHNPYSLYTLLRRAELHIHLEMPKLTIVLIGQQPKLPKSRSRNNSDEDKRPLLGSTGANAAQTEEKELLIIQFKSAVSNISIDAENYSLLFRLASLQMDNCDSAAVFPIVFTAANSRFILIKPRSQRDLFSFGMKNSFFIAFQKVLIGLSEKTIRIDIDENFLRNFIFFYKTVANGGISYQLSPHNNGTKFNSHIHKSTVKQMAAILNNNLIFGANSHNLSAQNPAKGKKFRAKQPEEKAKSAGYFLYFNEFELSKVSLRYSYQRTSFIASRLIREDPLKELIYESMDKLLASIVLDAESAPLSFDGTTFHQHFSPVNRFLEELKSFYIKEVTSQALMVVGSKRSLGNPIGLIQSLGSSVNDLFDTPITAIKQGTSIREGIKQGSSNFVRSSAHAVGDSSTGFSAGLGKQLAKLSLDKQYQQKRNMKQTRNKPQTALEGFSSGLSRFGSGLLSGLTGIVTQPIKAAERGGDAVDVLAGVGRGLIGAVVKPIVGSVDAINSVSQGIKNEYTPQELKQALINRTPRVIRQPNLPSPAAFNRTKQTSPQQLEGKSNSRQSIPEHSSNNNNNTLSSEEMSSVPSALRNFLSSSTETNNLSTTEQLENNKKN